MECHLILHFWGFSSCKLSLCPFWLLAWRRYIHTISCVFFIKRVRTGDDQYKVAQPISAHLSRQCTEIMFRAAIVCCSAHVGIRKFVCICAHLWLPVGICSSAITGCLDTIFFITWMSQCCIKQSQKTYPFFERCLYLY